MCHRLRSPSQVRAVHLNSFIKIKKGLSKKGKSSLPRRKASTLVTELENKVALRSGLKMTSHDHLDSPITLLNIFSIAVRRVLRQLFEVHLVQSYNEKSLF